MATAARQENSVPDQFASFEELASFWEEHDLTDYHDQMEEVDYQVAPTPARQFLVTLSDELTRALRKAAQHEGVSMQTLINLWVQDRLQQFRAAS